jgi:nitrogen fixation protein FixH
MAELTGKHVLAITVAFFGVIIAVNTVLAVKAVSTFPGLEVENSYVASQTWDKEMAAQKALGWQLAEDYDEAAKELLLTFTDSAGQPVQVKSLKVLVGRPTEAKDDTYPDFTQEAGVYVAKVPLAPGKWMLHVEAVAQDGTLYRRRIDLRVEG